MRSICLWNFKWVAWILFELCSGQNSRMKNEQRAITPKVWNFELWFLRTARILNEIYLPMKFHVDALLSFKVMLLTKFKYENKQRAITPKVWNFELWSLCNALLLNEIYFYMKFHVDALHSFEVMLRTKKRRTDGQTSQSLYATLWGHKNCQMLTTVANQ